jgi:hypothetical protein
MIRDILGGFWDQCARLQMDHDLFYALLMRGQGQIDLFQQVAPMFFADLHRLMRDSLFIQFCRITDPAGSGSRTNLTTNYLLQVIPWPPDIKKKLDAVNARLMQFRPYIEPARSKRLAHADLRAELDKVTLGKLQFLKDLEEFLTIAHEHLGATAVSLSIGMSHDAHALVRALVKSRIYDTCAKCTPTDRAVLDYERGPNRTSHRPASSSCKIATKLMFFISFVFVPSLTNQEPAEMVWHLHIHIDV